MAMNEDGRRITPETGLRSALADYESKSHTPELLTATFQAIWKDRESRVAHLLDKPLAPVVPCDRTAEEIKQLEAEGRRLAYLPPELATQENRHILGSMFPKMQGNSVEEGNTVTNEQVRSGWFDYEAAIQAPHLYTNEKKLRKLLAKQGRLGMNITEYVIAGQDSKLFTGKYLDQDSTYVRLLGSRYDGDVVSAGFGPDGLVVSWSLGPDRHGPGWGGRSVGVK